MNLLNIRMILVATTALSLFSTSAMAGDLRLEIESQTTHTTDASFDLISSEDYQRNVNLAVGYSVPHLIKNLSVLFMYQNTLQQLSDINTFNGDMKTEWHQVRFMAGIDYGPELWGFFRPKARIGLGYSLQDLTIRSSGNPLQDYAHDFAAFGALGADVMLHLDRVVDANELPYMSRLSIGLQGMYGYSLQTAAQFDELRTGSDDLPEDDPWKRSDVDMGTLNNNGAFWTFGFVFNIRL